MFLLDLKHLDVKEILDLFDTLTTVSTVVVDPVLYSVSFQKSYFDSFLQILFRVNHPKLQRFLWADEVDFY